MGTGKCHEPSGLRKPLIPTNQNPQSAHRSIYGPKTEIARRKVVFFVIAWVIGDMHFAVYSGEPAISIQHHRCIMVYALGAPFEDRAYDYDLQLYRQTAERIGGWPWNRFSVIKRCGVFTLTKVRPCVKFLQ